MQTLKGHFIQRKNTEILMTILGNVLLDQPEKIMKMNIGVKLLMRYIEQSMATCHQKQSTDIYSYSGQMLSYTCISTKSLVIQCQLMYIQFCPLYSILGLSLAGLYTLKQNSKKYETILRVIMKNKSFELESDLFLRFYNLLASFQQPFYSA